MKYCLFWVLLAGIGYTSCKKTAGGSSRILLYNATYSISKLNGSLSGINLTPVPLAQGQVTGTVTVPYIKIPAGTHHILLVAGANSFLDKNIYTPASQPVSLLVYDSIPASGGVNTILIYDVYSLPDTASISCRFINCVADTATDLVLTSPKDTLRLTATFIGPRPLASQLGSFTGFRTHGMYKPFIYKSGTTQLLLTSDSVLLDRQKTCSFIYSGTPGGTGSAALKLGVVFHPVD